jgi:hypothetical protein
MNNPKRKKRILRSLDLAEDSAVDRPAQAPAQAILRKSNTMNTEEIIREATGVEFDGQEPRYSADEYDAAILGVARLDQKPGESIAQTLARVTSDGDPEITSLLFAADRVRAREAAASSVGKSAPAEPSPVAKDAQRVAKSGTSPRYTRDDYHDEMMALAKAEARRGEDAVSAFARLCGEGRFDELYAAGERAEVAEVESAMAKAAPEDRFYPMLLDMAKMRRAPGETIEAACARLLERDPVVRDAYAATQGL